MKEVNRQKVACVAEGFEADVALKAEEEELKARLEKYSSPSSRQVIPQPPSEFIL